MEYEFGFEPTSINMIPDAYRNKSARYDTLIDQFIARHDECLVKTFEKNESGFKKASAFGYNLRHRVKKRFPNNRELFVTVRRNAVYFYKQKAGE